jgi:hypothetical protein
MRFRNYVAFIYFINPLSTIPHMRDRNYVADESGCIATIPHMRDCSYNYIKKSKPLSGEISAIN